MLGEVVYNVKQAFQGGYIEGTFDLEVSEGADYVDIQRKSIPKETANTKSLKFHSAWSVKIYQGGQCDCSRMNKEAARGRSQFSICFSRSVLISSPYLSVGVTERLICMDDINKLLCSPASREVQPTGVIEERPKGKRAARSGHLSPWLPSCWVSAY